MQCLQGRYIGEVVCMYKKNGSGKGTQHESVLFAGTKDVLSLTNLGLRVFVQVSGTYDLSCMLVLILIPELLRRTLKKMKTHFKFGTTVSPLDIYGHLPVSRNSSTISEHLRSASQTTGITLLNHGLSNGKF